MQIQPRRFYKKLPLQANFYPMPTMAYIQDSQYRLTLHTAQALGVTSLDSGQLSREAHPHLHACTHWPASGVSFTVSCCCLLQASWR